MSFNGGQHFGGGAHVHTSYTGGNCQIGGAADERDFGAALCGSFGHGVAHAFRRTGGEKAHRVDGFLSGTGGEQNVLPFEIATKAEHFAYRGHDGVLSGEAAGAGHATGEITFIGADDVNAAAAQTFQIFLRGGMIPHVDVHGGGDHYGRGGGEI